MPPIALDDRDVAILSILSREGRIAKSELARRVNLSASPCWARLRRLEAAGLIRGYNAEIALEALGAHVTVFVTVELADHRADTFRRFEQGVGLHDEIVAVWALGGGFDYLMQVVSPSIDAYQRLIDALLQAEIGLRRYFTYVVTKEVKRGAPPIAALLAGGRTD
jgi:Lrp/AsnC family transcriptional regulator of ectoine degradation